MMCTLCAEFCHCAHASVCLWCLVKNLFPLISYQQKSSLIKFSLDLFNFDYNAKKN